LRCPRRRLPVATRIITEGCSSRAGGRRGSSPGKSVRYDGVGFGGGQHPLHVPVPQPHRHRTPTLNLRQGEIGSCGLLPCRTDRLRNVSAEWNSYREPRCIPRDRLNRNSSRVPSARCGRCSTRTSRSAAAAVGTAASTSRSRTRIAVWFCTYTYVVMVAKGSHTEIFVCDYPRSASKDVGVHQALARLRAL
jgi:hypothetical protein